ITISRNSDPKIVIPDCLVGQITGSTTPSPRRHEGTLRDRHGTLARVAMDAVASGACTGRKRFTAYGEVVWSWRRDPGVKPRGKSHAGDGGKRGRSPGRARKKPSNHCAGKAGMTG